MLLNLTFICSMTTYLHYFVIGLYCYGFDFLINQFS